LSKEEAWIKNTYELMKKRCKKCGALLMLILLLKKIVMKPYQIRKIKLEKRRKKKLLIFSIRMRT